MRLLQFNVLRLHRWQYLAGNRTQFYSTEGCTDFTQTKLTTEMKHNIENHWRSRIKNIGFDESKPDDKFVVVPMFPYPSGYLHLGHVRVYTISDAIARFYRLKGKNVLHPIGWDAFGLPAENAAIERKISPTDWTKTNIEHMRVQLGQLGCSFDWERELSTCDPAYYKWTQWLFLQMHKDGMAYQREAFVNWDPIDKTVLANEQVDENGCSWRSGAKVERKLLRQWFIRSTNFAKDLYEGLNSSDLIDWDNVIKMQKEWIGEPNGYNFHLDLHFINNNDPKLKTLTIWTEKPEQLMNPGFIAIKSDHILNENGGNNRLLDISVKNPFSEGSLIPIIVCDDLEYLPKCDTYLGLPAINEIDRTLAKKHWLSFDEKAPIEKNRDSILKKAKSKNIGGHPVSSHFGDWLISRQRYWGTPIPMIHCTKCGTLPVPESALPIELPETKFDDAGKPIPLAKHTEWLKVKCHKCGNENAQRETDTMDTFVDSSWYFLRYLNPKKTNGIFEKSLAKKVMPIDVYIGGIEHAVLHLYMARLLMHFCKKIGFVATPEPFKRLIVQGMIKGRTFVSNDGRFLKEDDVNILNEKENRAEETITGQPVRMEWEKMSKSKKNGVDPSELFEEYSVDTIRLIMLGDVVPKSARNWSKETFPGIINWQHRLWLLLNEFNKARIDNKITAPDPNDINYQNEELKLFELRNSMVVRAENYYENAHFNLAIKICQELTDELRACPRNIVKYSVQYERAMGNLLMTFAPIAPLFASECWSKFVSVPNRIESNEKQLKWDKDVLEQSWPKVDTDYKNLLVIKLNGSKTILRKGDNDPETITKEYLLQKAHEHTALPELLKTQAIKQCIFIQIPNQTTAINIETSKKKKDKKDNKKKKGQSDSENTDDNVEQKSQEN